MPTNQPLLFADHKLFLKELSEYWDLVKTSTELSRDNKFESDDLRNTTFATISHQLNRHYANIQMPFFFDRINRAFEDGILKPYFSVDSEENIHFSNITGLANPDWLKTYHDAYKAQLVFTLWILFEDLIDVIYEKVATEQIKEKRRLQYFSKISSILSKYDLTIGDLNDIKSKLWTEFIGLGDKYNLIFEIINTKKRFSSEVKYYRSILEFINTIRNSLHYNSRPLKDRTFTFPFGVFEFRKGEFLSFPTDPMIPATRELLKCIDFIRQNLSLEGKLIHSAAPVPSQYSSGSLES